MSHVNLVMGCKLPTAMSRLMQPTRSLRCRKAFLLFEAKFGLVRSDKSHSTYSNGWRIFSGIFTSIWNIMVKWEHYNGKQAENIQWNGKIMQVLEMEYLHFNYK